MPSSWSPSLRFELQFTGENINLWGEKLSNTLARVDDAIAGYVSIAITGDHTLTTSNDNSTQDQARRAHQKFTGTLAANAAITLPSVSKSYWIWNATDKALTFTTGSGGTATVEAGDILPVWCDGANVKTIMYGTYNLKDYIAAQTAAAGAVPGTTGHLGKFLKVTVDAGAPTWQQLATSDINAFSATASVVRTGTSTAAALTPGDTYNALSEVTLTDATTIAVDMSTFVNARVTLGGNRTLGNPTNPKVGQGGLVAVVQDGTGSRTLSFGSNWKRSGGAPTLTTTPGAIDFITYQVITSTYILYDLIRSPS